MFVSTPSTSPSEYYKFIKLPESISCHITVFQSLQRRQSEEPELLTSISTEHVMPPRHEGDSVLLQSPHQTIPVCWDLDLHPLTLRGLLAAAKSWFRSGC